jgi:hypothetical protein
VQWELGELLRGRMAALHRDVPKWSPFEEAKPEALVQPHGPNSPLQLRVASAGAHSGYHALAKHAKPSWKTANSSSPAELSGFPRGPPPLALGWVVADRGRCDAQLGC